jgi:tripartite ATP-independent transporter DctM subunit
MEPVAVGLAGIAALMAVIFLFRMPVGFAMALVGYLGFALVVNPRAALNMVGGSLWQTFSSYGLTVIPFFILMGNICFAAGLSERIYRAAYTWIGHVRGGVAMATVMACAGFAAICGSNAATAATMSTVALPEMRRFGYDNALSTGSVACGATLGVVIPPSVVLILIGLSTGDSIARLFFAALIPGLILTGLFVATVWVVCRVQPGAGPRGPRMGWKEKLASLPGSVEMLLLFALIMGGLFAGWFTPTEAGAAAAFFALVISLAGRHLTWKKFLGAVDDSIRMSCMILVIVAGAVIFGRFLTITRIPFEAAEWITGLPIPRGVILVLMLLLFAVGGAIMDALGLLMIMIPIFYPVAVKLGYDPLWFSVVITVITTMGAVTPPVGVNAFVVAAMSRDVPMTTVFRGVSYFLFSFAACIGIMMAFPATATLLPALLR